MSMRWMVVAAVALALGACSPLDIALGVAGELIRMNDNCNDASCDGDEIPDAR